MSEKNTNTEPEVPALVKKAPELLPLWDWWVKEGRSTLMMVVIAGLAVAAFYAGRNWLRARDAAANAALEISSSPAAMRSRIRRKYAGYRRIVGRGSGPCLSPSFIDGPLYHISPSGDAATSKYRYFIIAT